MTFLVPVAKHGIGTQTDTGIATNLLPEFLRKAEEGALGRILVGALILLSMHSQV